MCDFFLYRGCVTIMTMKCSFCTLPEIKNRTVAKNDLAFAFLTYIPIVPGHVLISPARCVAKFGDLSDEEVAAFFELRAKLEKALIKTFSAEGFNYAWNEGKAGGQSVSHFHLHMIPRKEGDKGIYKYEPREFLYRSESSESRPVTPEEELLDVAKLIREAAE